MLETDNPTRREKASRSQVWGIITQATQESRHTGSGYTPLPTHAIRDSRKTIKRHMRSMRKQRAYRDASYTQTGRPEQTGQKGEAALDENHDSAQTEKY